MIKWNAKGVQIILLLSLFLLLGGITHVTADTVISDSSSQTLVAGGADDFATGTAIKTSVFDSFLYITPDGKPTEGKLVSSWEKSDDGLTYIFHLKEGIKFHDGTPWDENAAKWFFDWCKEGPLKDTLVYKKIDEISAPAENTVQITLTEPYGSFLKDLAGTSCMVISSGSVSPAGSTTGEQTSYVGTGPFKVKDYVKGQKTELEKAESDTADGTITNIVYQVIPDEYSRVSALRAGDVDIIGATEHHAAIPYEMIPVLKSDDNFKVEQKSYGRYQVIEMNCKKGPLADQNVREAINHAIDRDSMVKSLLSGAVSPAKTIVPPSYGFSSSLTGTEYTYDLEKAKSMLKEDGWSDSNGDGILEKGNEILELEYVVPKGEANAEQIAVFIQSELKKLGAQVNVNTLESGAAYDRAYSGDYDLFVHHSGGIPALPEYPITSKYYSKTAIWPDAYKDNQLDSMIAAAIISGSDQDYSKVYKYLQDKNACIPLYDVEKIIAFNKDVSGFTFPPSIYHADFSKVKISS
jgi:peptide/nickel transport system substrate-binding protein